MAGQLFAAPAYAQRAVPVSLVLKDSFGRDDIVAILRIDPSRYSTPVLALKRDAATAELLASMISALTHATAKSATPYTSMEWTTKQAVRSPDGPALRQADALLKRLRATSVSSHPKIGHVRELAVTLQVALANTP